MRIRVAQGSESFGVPLASWMCSSPGPFDLRSTGAPGERCWAGHNGGAGIQLSCVDPWQDQEPILGCGGNIVGQRVWD